MSRSTSPQFRAITPEIDDRSLSPPHSRESPVYMSSSTPPPPPPQQQQRHRQPPPPPSINIRNKKKFNIKNTKIVTQTLSLYIPLWATSFVLGGRNYKNIYKLCNRYGDIVTAACDPFTFRQPNRAIVTVVVLIGFGDQHKLNNALYNIKTNLMHTLKKAQEMKCNGTWRT
jgi:hypothetical protein